MCDADTLTSQNISGMLRASCVLPFQLSLGFLKYTSPPSALGFWIPLEKCTPENGALSFLPGSHKTTPITKRFVRLPNGKTGMEQLKESQDAQTPPATTVDYQLVECNPGRPIRRLVEVPYKLKRLWYQGDLVIIHGSVLHKSPRNTSNRTRYVSFDKAMRGCKQTCVGTRTPSTRSRARRLQTTMNATGCNLLRRCPSRTFYLSQTLYQLDLLLRERSSCRMECVQGKFSI